MAVEVIRKNTAVVLRADLPGIKPDEVKITVEATTEDGVLEVTIPLPEAEEKKPVEIKPKSKAE